ncbi:MAG: valine--tRNA ligase [Chitinophagales bacterium]
MEISKTFSPQAVEDKWYAHWMAKKYFHSEPDNREPYTIVIPPPNVTGVLHMGHVLNNTIPDVLIRRARMQNKNACWVPGTDHASIATEAKVVKMLRERGIRKADLSRDAFMTYAWEWKQKYGGIIIEQLKKLGCSCDWDRLHFTMDPEYYDDVINVFIDLYDKGHIYRGLRMINWDPAAKTALSNEEVIYKDVVSKLYYVRYAVDGMSEGITIATTRPETILGDTAICVHPDDPRYTAFVGKTARVPLLDRAIPIIADAYVESSFGTGALKVTPAHDVNDYELGQKHKLEVINIMDDGGILVEAAGMLVGEDRFAARKKIVAMLEEKGMLVKVEDLNNSVGYSERTDAVVEPRLSMQWFLNMPELAKPALEAVENGDVHLHPAKFINTYRHWMQNVRDWCISRQLWWGHRIPAWYDADGSFVVAKTAEDAVAKFTAQGKNYRSEDLKQDEDVLDTWASSWLWPISVFHGFGENKKDIDYYYPTNTLVTAPEILFFWVARMIIAGYEYTGEKPFNDVYLTGIVRDKQRRKMSKSLGNSPEPLELIEKYGADGVRMGILLCSPAGNDIIYDDKLVEQGRNFSNKIWNAARLIQGWEVTEEKSNVHDAAIRWMEAKCNAVIAQVDAHFDAFRINDALMALYGFVWDDFCSWYLEFVKPPFGGAIDRATYQKTIEIFDKALALLHPFMPFITEEIYHLIAGRETDLIVSAWPATAAVDMAILEEGELAKEVISKVRDARARNNISPKEAAPLFLQGDANVLIDFRESIRKLANLTEIRTTHEEVGDAIAFLAGNTKCWLLVARELDVDAERRKFTEQIDYLKGFLVSVDKKLSNEKFVQSAPEQVVETERRKKTDAEEKIRILEESLRNLN